jgi:hypothetical protein
MFARFLFALIFLNFTFELLGQTLTISSAANSGSYSYSSGTLTVSGAANIQATQIQSWLGSGDLSIVGSTSALTVNVNQAITSTSVGSDLTIGLETNTGTINIDANLTIAGAITLRGGTVQFDATIASTQTGAPIQFLSKGQVVNTALTTITTQGGSILFAADTDNNAAGNIYIPFTFTLDSNGGSITFAGGDFTGSGYASGFGIDFEEGIDIRGTTSINSDGGNIIFRGKSDIGVATVQGIYGVGFWDATTSKTINAGSGTILIEGFSYGTDTSNDFNFGVTFEGTTVTLVSSNSTSNAIVIKGSNEAGDGTVDGRGIDLRATNTKIYATEIGGGIRLEGGGYYGFTIYGTTEILAKSGPIQLINTIDGVEKDIYLNGSLWLGSKAATSVTTSSSPISIKANDFDFTGDTPFIGTTGTFTFEPITSSASFDDAFTSSLFAWNQNSQTISGLTLGKVGNTADITLAAIHTVAGPVSIYGGDIAVNQNVTSSLSGADILLQATGAISLATSKVIQTNAGDITFRSNASGTPVPLTSSAIGAITLADGSSLLSTGGNITLGGNYTGAKGAGLYAATNRAGGSPGILISNATLTAAGGNINVYGKCISNYDDGIRLQANMNTTGAGTIGIYGESYGGLNTSTNPDVFFGGITFITAASTIETDAGNINVEATLTNTLSSGTYALNFYRTTFSGGTPDKHIQLLSKSGNIQVTGDRGSTSAGGMGSSSWGNIYVGSPLAANSWTATGNIKFSYSSFVGAANNGFIVKTTGGVTYEPASTSFTIAQIFPYNANYVLAQSASSLTIGKDGNTAGVTIGSNQSVAGDIDIYAGTITLNGNLTATNGGDISLYSNNAIGGLSAQRNVTAAGIFSYASQANSFSAAVTYPITNLNVSSAGLLIGKTTNTSNITLNAATINGPITAYGGAITVSGALSAAGNILLDGDTGNFLTQDIKGVVINAAVSTTSASNGNITLLGRGGNGSVGYYGNHGIHIQNVIEAGGTGNIELIGYGGLSSSGNNSGCHGVNIDGSNAWVKTNGGNINVIGYGGGAGTGTYSQGVQVWNNSKVSSGGSGTITMSGTGGVNAAWGMRGLVLQVGNIYSAGGAIQLTGIAGSNGTDNSDGLVIYNATLGSSSSGPITISGSAGVCSVCDAITISAASTLGAAGHAYPITIKGNNFAITETNNINTTGLVTIEPTGTSFTSVLQFPVANLSIANTITGLTLGKSTNTTGITIGAATSIDGPITLYGGTLALNNALTTTNTNTGNLSLNGTTLTGASTLTVANGRTLTMNISSNTNYAGLISGTSLNFVKDGAGTLTLPTPTSHSFAAMTISGGGFTLNANQQLTLTAALTNNGTFTMKDGATFVQGTSGTTVTGTGTYNVEKALTGNTSSWSNTSGRFWYMGVPMVSVLRSGYGNYVSGSNHVWSYSEANKQYTDIISNAATLSAGTGYVHRRGTDGTLTFTATGTNGLYGDNFSLANLTRTAGNSAGYHLISNPYMAFLDWQAVTKTNIEPTYYIRTNNSTGGNISALISYNANLPNLYTNTSNLNLTAAQLRYIAPMQSIWVRVATAAATGSLGMTRSMLSHPNNNVGLKSSTVFPNLARVNLVDGNNFDQLLVYLNGDMSNEVDEYDSEKMPVGGTVQVYTMSSNKKLVMNGLKNNKKKVSVPLYLELPQTKSYTLQLSEYQVEDGLILLEDKQEGTIQDFTLMENYSFYANSGLLQNRFVLHFILPNAELATQGPSNSWVAAEDGSYTEGGDVEISNDAKGNIEITLNQAAEQKVEGTVFVTDMNGKEVYNGKLEGITTAIELDVPSGIYYLTVQSGTLIEKKKVFIQE